MRGPKRREIGHGNLAERALKKMLASEEDFPYAIRVSSEEIGRLAFESLTELVRTPDSEGDPIRIPGQLVIRKSTAPAPVEAPSSPSLTG